MEDSLYIAMPEDEWSAVYLRRIDVQNRIQKEDDLILDDIYAYFKSSAHIPNYQYDSLLMLTSQLYTKTIDPFITEHLVSFTLSHYTKMGDEEHLFQCRTLLALALTQIAQEGEAEAYFTALELLQKAVAYGYEHYREFRFRDSYDYYTRLYQELLRPRWLIQRKQTIEDLYDRYRELQELYVWMNQHTELNIDSRSKRRAAETYFNFEYDALDFLMSEYNQNRSQPDVMLLAKFAKKHHEAKQDLLKLDPEGGYKSTWKRDVQYYKILNFIGLSSPLESFRSIDSIYQEIKTTQNIRRNLSDLINFVGEAVCLLDITDELDKAEKEQIALSYLKDLSLYAKKVRAAGRQSQLYDQLETLAMNPHFYNLFDLETRKELVEQMIVRSDAEIYSHSMLTAWIGWNMMEMLITRNPSMLIGEFGCKDEADVLAHRDDFHEFFWTSCQLHDLGLNRMSSTTNRHYRSLTSHERQLLRNHLVHGASIIRLETHQARFYEMIIGHHKWYNGKGFPNHFDNISSPNRILIDLLSIADFLEGGSELPSEGYMGNFEQRVKDLRSHAGTRFNPELVEMVLGDHGVMTRTRMICGEEQRHLRYTVYKEYFDQKKKE